MQAERSAKRSYGTGSITERDGNYYGKWRIDGQQVSRKLGVVRRRGSSDGLTRSQAEAILREKMAEVRPEDVQRVSMVASSGRRTIAELGTLYVEYGRTHKGLKETTLTDYELAVRLHLVPFFGATPVSRIDSHGIERFAAHLQTKTGQGRRGGKPLSPKTIENYVGTLAVLLNFAVKRKWIAASPMAAADLPRFKDADRPIDELTFLERAEVARLVDGAVAGDYRALDRALYTLATYTGLRQGELRGLRWAQVDFGRSLVHVLEGVTRGRESSPKGKRRRSVPLAPTAAQALLTLRAESLWTEPQHRVFACPSTGNPMARAGLMDRYRKALKAAKLAESFSFHDLRHTFGTTMARAGVPVGTIQEWMGHADLATTQIYMHYAPRATDAALIDSAFGSPESPTNLPTNLRIAEGTEGNSANEEAA
jgi:integrase